MLKAFVYFLRPSSGFFLGVEFTRAMEDVGHIGSGDPALEATEWAEEAAPTPDMATSDQVMKPRKYVPLVDSVWLEEQKLCLERQRFLVLDGRSRLGKTQFALQIKGADRTLKVNCAQCLREPDLRAFVQGRHEAIIFDEAHCQMVVNCKRLFQAPPFFVQMASSATNCFGYSVCVHRVLLIVCSHNWKAELEELPRDDADWLDRNSVYVAVSAPMWDA